MRVTRVHRAVRQRCGLAARRRGKDRAKIPRVGYIGGSSPTTAGHILEAFQQGLRELGYVEGQTIAVEVRWGRTVAD